MVMHRSVLPAVLLLLLATAVAAGYDVRIDCHPDFNADQSSCQARGCIWNSSEPAGTPWCYFPAGDLPTMAGYDTSSADASAALLQRRNTPTLFGGDAQQIKALVKQIDDNVLSVKLTSDLSAQPITHYFEPKSAEHVTVADTDGRTGTADQTFDYGNLQLTIKASPFGLQVRRKDGSSSANLFDSYGWPGMTFAESMIQITTKVPTKNVYGIGEQEHFTLQRDFNWNRLSLFDQDHEPDPNTNLYGNQPFYLGLDDSNQAYGVYAKTSFPMDVYLQPDPALISFRIVGGGQVEFFFYVGPTCDDVIRQHVGQVGMPFMPPYWALGFQLSRYGYKSLQDLETVWDRNRAQNIPQDVQTIDIDYMDNYLDFTIGQAFNGLPAFVTNTIHGTGRKFVPIVDPGIASTTQVDPDMYKPLKLAAVMIVNRQPQDGMAMDIFVKDAQGGYLEGNVWPGNTFFPDFSNPTTTQYWTQCLADFASLVAYDGLWIDMNDPSNFVYGSTTGCATNSINNPPWLPTSYSPLYKKTLCLDAVHYGGLHIQCHNLYGHQEAKACYQALLANNASERPFVYTRSTAPGTGAFAGHWMGDTKSDWKNLNQSIIALLEFNMFGVPLCGTDICGFNGNTTEQLCLRWHQLGAFYPFSRNHNTNDAIAQDPAVWSQPTIDAIRFALDTRYTLLPYLYTLFYYSHTTGSPVARPMLFDYPSLSDTWSLHEQFLWGSGLLIAPVLSEVTNQKYVFFPKGNWFMYNGGAIDGLSGQDRWHLWTMNNVTDTLFVKGGSVIVRQGAAQTTEAARQQPLDVLVAPDQTGAASGQLFWDDGHTVNTIEQGRYCLVKLNLTGSSLTTSCSMQACGDIPLLQTAYINAVPAKPTSVSVNGAAAQFDWTAKTQLLRVNHLNVQLSHAANTITWS